MRCSKCHKRIKSNFCPFCGAPNTTPPLKVRFRNDSHELFSTIHQHKLSLVVIGLLAAVTVLIGLAIGSGIGRASLKEDLAQSEANLTRLDSDYAKLREENAALEERLKQAEAKLEESESQLQLYTSPDTVAVEEGADSADTAAGTNAAAGDYGGMMDSAAESNGSLPEDLVFIPAYAGSASIPINGNTPFFTDSDLTSFTGITYSELDELGRAGTATALIGPETLTDEKTGRILSVEPSGWQVIRESQSSTGFLFHRCHLIDWPLAGGYADPLNLITGTRALDAEAMAPYEAEVLDYVKTTGCHVLYRATPLFYGNDLVAGGVLLEASSVEDNGDALTFCVFCYNVQPGVTFDYATGMKAGG